MDQAITHRIIETSCFAHPWVRAYFQRATISGFTIANRWGPPFSVEVPQSVLSHKFAGTRARGGSAHANDKRGAE
eukprot:11226794-Lingulodinium_polyedra.AAC.1